MTTDQGERVCSFVLERVKSSAGARWLQGRARPPIPCTHPSPAVRLFAEHRLHRIEAGVARGLVAIAEGQRDIDLLTYVPRPADVLSLQARGRRCVSLLEDGAITKPHENALAFALHDLCHLEKFVDPEHHVGQVGFFARLEAATKSAAWGPFDRALDDVWRSEFEHVACDMNGSVVFLVAALKMKLKMAVRRKLGPDPQSPEGRHSGPLDARELRAYDEALETLLDLLGMEGSVRDAARRISTKRDAKDAALEILGYFSTIGGDALASVVSAMPRVSGSTHTQDAVASASTSGTLSPPARP
jgi:hypothetical protein